jgi:hypothetical protein
MGGLDVTDRSKTVVMLIDWDNLQICHSRDAPGTDLDLQALIALAQSYGTLVSARAYAEWNLLSERLAVYKAGIEPVFAPVMRPEGSPREGKSLADTVMVADGVDLLWTVAPDVFVLVTSDKDMIPLARIAKQRGAAVVILGSDLTAIPLVEISNVFITYRQLLRELDRVVELEAPSGRAPARERRLRESRRPSSEPYGGPAPIGSGNAIGSGARGAGPIGAGPRSGGRAAMSTSTRTRVATVEPSTRRGSEGTGAGEPDRPALVAASSPSSVAAAPSEPVEELDQSAGATDATPRRRRRRGGRGRRSGLGLAGDGEQTAATGATDLEEAPGDVEHEPEAVATSPDDLDSAVLELLAARDREAEPEQAGEPAPAASAEEPPAPGRGRSTSRRTLTGGRTPARRRAVTTTFSEFGPPSGVARSTSPTTTDEPSVEEPAPTASGAEAKASATLEAASAEGANAARTEAAPVTEEDAERPAGGAIWPPGGTDLTGPTSDVEPAPANATPAVDATPAADATPAVNAAGPNGSSAEAAASPTTTDADAGEGSEAGDAAKPPARRRRTRRPSTTPRTRRGANASSGDAGADAPVAAESGT